MVKVSEVARDGNRVFRQITDCDFLFRGKGVEFRKGDKGFDLKQPNALDAIPFESSYRYRNVCKSILHCCLAYATEIAK